MRVGKCLTAVVAQVAAETRSCWLMLYDFPQQEYGLNQHGSCCSAHLCNTEFDCNSTIRCPGLVHGHACQYSPAALHARVY
jgi:hypothetical protein